MLFRSVKVTVDNNWRIAPISSQTNLDIRFESSPTEEAKAYIESHSLYPTKFIEKDKLGFGVYQLNLQAPSKLQPKN